MLIVDFKEIAMRQNLEQILENLFKGMNSSDEECKFGLQGQLDYVGSLNALQ